MKHKILAIFLVLLLILTMTACGQKEEETTTLMGMVVSVEGSVISLMEMDGTTGGMNFADGEMPSRPEGMEGFQGFDGTFPEGERPSRPEGMEGFQGFDGTFPEGERPSRPEGMEGFEGFDGTFPEGERPSRPEGMEGFEGFDGTFPEGETMPENGDFSQLIPGGNGGMRPGFGNFDFEGETTQIDIGDAHISVEIDGGKASGTLEDITAGSFVTITKNSDGEVTNVLVSSRSGFGGGKRS